MCLIILPVHNDLAKKSSSEEAISPSISCGLNPNNLINIATLSHKSGRSLVLYVENMDYNLKGKHGLQSQGTHFMQTKLQVSPQKTSYFLVAPIGHCCVFKFTWSEQIH